MESLFHHHGGTFLPLGPSPWQTSAPTVSVDDWQHAEFLLQSWIYGHHLLWSLQYGFSKTAWSSLSLLFTDNKDYRAIQLEKKFKSLKNGSLSIHDYCQLIKTTDSLADVSQPVADKQLVLQTLHGFPKSYGTVTNLIEVEYRDVC